MIAYFDCLGGASGDMVLGALLDAGADLTVLEATVTALGLRDEASLHVSRGMRGHVGGLQVAVRVTEGGRRRFPELVDTVQSAGLSEYVLTHAVGALHRLGRAESRVHDEPAAQLHLHELGGVDTLVDVVGAFALLASLGVEKVFASPLPAPRGWISPELPLPAPATLEILAGTGAVLVPSDAGRELVTPTGAAILAEIAEFRQPVMRLERVGYGLGGRDLPGNALRTLIGELAEGAVDGRSHGLSGQADANLRDVVAVLETNLDDMLPTLLAALSNRLMDEGALDVTITPVLMKKGRPGHALTVIAAVDDAERLTQRILRSSPTLGLRRRLTERTLAGRETITRETAAGPIRVKHKLVDGVVVGRMPEYEDCLSAAAASGMELAEVHRLALEADTPHAGGDIQRDSAPLVGKE